MHTPGAWDTGRTQPRPPTPPLTGLPEVQGLRGVHPGAGFGDWGGVGVPTWHS